MEKKIKEIKTSKFRHPNTFGNCPTKFVEILKKKNSPTTFIRFFTPCTNIYSTSGSNFFPSSYIAMLYIEVLE